MTSYCFLNYSGDQDSVIPLTGSRKLVNGLAKELGLRTTVPYRVWFEGQQVNLLKTTKNLSILMVTVMRKVLRDNLTNHNCLFHH